MDGQNKENERTRESGQDVLEPQEQQPDQAVGQEALGHTQQEQGYDVQPSAPAPENGQYAPWQQKPASDREQPAPAQGQQDITDGGWQDAPAPGQQGQTSGGWQNAPAPGQQDAPASGQQEQAGGGWQNAPTPGQQGQAGSGWQGAPGQQGPAGGWQNAPAPGQQGPAGGWQGAPGQQGQTGGGWQPWNGNTPQQRPYPQGGIYQPPYQQDTPQRNFYGQGMPPQGPQPDPYGPGRQPQQKPSTNNMAVSSMVLGIASILLSCCCFPVGFIIGFALGMGGLALAVISKKGQPFSAFAIAGLVLSILGICGSLFIFGCYMLTAQMMKDPEYSALFNEIFQQYYNGN